MKIVLITRHCLKRVLERAKILDEYERMKLIEEILLKGKIVDKKGKNILVKFNEHYLILRLSSKGLIAISYTSGVVPRGFSEKLTNLSLEKPFKLKKLKPN